MTHDQLHRINVLLLQLASATNEIVDALKELSEAIPTTPDPTADLPTCAWCRHTIQPADRQTYGGASVHRWCREDVMTMDRNETT